MRDSSHEPAHTATAILESPSHAAHTAGPALYLVATPIGNLEDITLRAVRVLKEVDVIACEDTRQTQKLLNHYGVATRTISYHEHNEMTRAAELVKEMQEGASVALVTDAGMPGISDPGFRLISLAIRHHLPVVPIPGASAFLAALVASGLPTDSFRFSGFLPAKRGERRAALEAIKNSPRTQVFYEAPHRIVEALPSRRGPGKRPACGDRARSDQAARRVFAWACGRSAGDVEGARRSEGRDHVADREGGRSGVAVRRTPRPRSSVRQRVEQIMAEEKVDEKAALKKVAKERGISKSEAYRELQRSK